MTKYIDKYYLNGTEYKIKFGGGGGGWQPGADTIAYYPLTSNADDSSTLGNGTVIGTVTYVSDGNTMVANIENGNNYISLPNITINDSSAYTFSIWGKKVSNVGSWGVFVDMGDGNDGIIRVQEYWSYGYPQVGHYIVNSSRNQFSSIDLTDWNLYTIVLDQGISYVYINAQLQLTSSFSGTYTSIAHKLGMQYDSGNDNMTKRLSKYIIENKARTAQEISDYFNQTKSLYGIA